MKEFSNVFDERGERRICSDSAEPEKQRMQFNVYFLGIGGIGMSALARYFLHEGRRVAGYDRVRSHLTDQIEAEGAVVHYEEDPALIPADFRDPATTIVVYTPAVPADHAELRWFRQNGFEIVKRSQMLGYLSQGKFVIAVAGTHGKTTTTTLVAWLNHRVTGGGSAFLGGISRNFSSNLVLGRGRRLAVEADEFDRSFLRLWPDVAVVSSADADHLDIYGTHEALREAFSQFVGQIREGGALVVKQGVDLKIGNPGIRVYRYSYDEPCDFYARNVTLLEGGHYRYDLVTPGGVIEGCTLGIPGWGNIENAVRHPTQFLKTYYQYSGSSWYVTPTNDALKEADLWGGNKMSSGYKTIFDPCPLGYMVPPDGAFATAAGDMSTGVNVDTQWGPFEGNGRAWIGGTGDFFPFVGILTINTPLTNCGHIGVYWTASADASNGYGYEVYVTSDWGRYRQGATAYGNSVRCVKEK